MPRRRKHALKINGAGDAVILRTLATNYRLWASLPAEVDALMAMAPAGMTGPKDAILDVLQRPVFPPGVCQTCGCTEFDPCFYPRTSDHDGSTCGWANRKQTHCTVCAGLSPEGTAVDHSLTPRPLLVAPTPKSKPRKKGRRS